MHQSPDILASFGDWETRMERALASVRAGRGVLVVDDEDRENEGDLVAAAEFVTPEIINFMSFFNDTATSEIYTLSLHDALPIWLSFRDCPQGGAVLRTSAVTMPCRPHKIGRAHV